MCDGPRPACHNRIPRGSFREPDEFHIGRKDPCSYCFPGGEIDVDDGDLLIGENSDSRKVIHRHESTGELESQSHGKHGPILANKLKDPDFGPEEAGLGGDA